MVDKKLAEQYIALTDWYNKDEEPPDITEARRQCQLVLDDREFDKKMDIYFAQKTLQDFIKKVLWP